MTGPAGWALVTGASSGIGAAFARALHARGDAVIAVARRLDRLQALQKELGEERLVPIACDLASPEGPRRLLDDVKTRGLTVSLLVNNAGVGFTGRFQEIPLERHLGTIDLDCRTLVELTHRVLPGMLERRYGTIVNVVSMSAFQPVPYMSVYAASKAFVLSFTEGLATELRGSGVRFQALCPGNIPTEFQQIAGTDRVAFDQKTPRTSPETVVAASLRALSGSRLIVFSSLADRLTRQLIPFAPGALVRRVAAGLFQPK